MRRRISWGYAFLAYIVVFMTGCGFLFVHAPPPDHEQRQETFSCTESNAGPILDFVWAGLNLTGALVAVSDSDIGERETAIVVGFGWTVFSTAAGVVGINKTKKCREARLAQNQRLREARRGGEEEVEPTLAPPAVDSTETVWGRIAEWTDPMFPGLPDSTEVDTTTGS